MKRLLLLTLLLSGFAHADYVRDTNWEGGGNGTLDLTNSGDPVVIVGAFAEFDYSSTFQGTAAIGTVSPETMTNGIAISTGAGQSPHGESYYRVTAKTGSTTIDVDLDSTWWYYAMLIEGFDSVLVDSCSFATGNGTNFGCSVTVPANGIAVMLFQTDTGASGRVWKQSATERAAVNGVSPTTRIYSATKVETTETTGTYGVDLGASNNGHVQVLVFAQAAGGPTVTFDQDTYNPSNTINATATGYGSAMTTATESVGGDVINAEAGATASDADFILCGASGFETAGACNNTQIGKVLTYTVAPDNATDTLTIQVPGADSFGQMACDPGNAVSNICDDDSLFNDIPATYDLGDEYWCEFIGGSGVCNDFGVVELSSAQATVRLRLFDVSLGVWGGMVEFQLTEPDLACEGVIKGSILSSPIRDPIREVICP